MESLLKLSLLLVLWIHFCTNSNQDHLTFVIPKQTGGNTIHLAHIKVEAGIQLTTASGNPPNNFETGGPGIVANILPSMFKEARLIDNGTVLNPRCDNCQFVSYLSSTLSYGYDAKKSQKCMEAYYQDDLLGVVQSNDINNADFMERRQRSLTKSILQTYKAYPSIFMGQLQTGIFFNEEGMLYDGCDVTIVFTQTTNEFRAFTSDETDDIVVTLVSLKLHVKISALMVNNTPALSRLDVIDPFRCLIPNKKKTTTTIDKRKFSKKHMIYLVIVVFI